MYPILKTLLIPHGTNTGMSIETKVPYGTGAAELLFQNPGSSIAPLISKVGGDSKTAAHNQNLAQKETKWGPRRG